MCKIKDTYIHTHTCTRTLIYKGCRVHTCAVVHTRGMVSVNFLY